MVVSYDLLYELEAVLLRPRFRSKLTFSDVIEYVIWLRENAQFVPSPLVTTSVSRDPDDDYLYALAMVTTSALVSDDPDLLELGSIGPVSIYSPRRFVDEVLRKPSG